MKRIYYLTGFTILIVFSFSVVSFSQSNTYEKSILFTLEWGSEIHQIGYRNGEPYDIWEKIGPTNFTVTSNNLIWIYDVVQNSIKAFHFNGELAHIFKLLEFAGTEGFITSDEHNNVWFHDAWNRRILMLNHYGELQKTITYESDSGLGGIWIRNGKPVMGPKRMLDLQRKLTDNGYGKKPEYKAQLVHFDSESIFNPYRGEKTNRVYRVTSVDVSNEGEIIPPRLFINNEIVQGFSFEEKIVRNYFFFFVREDLSGNFYIYAFPNSYEKDIFPFLIKYNENMEKVASIELPLISQKYGFATDPKVIDETGNIYYMMVRSEYITLLKWSLL